mmetsp:Transcript_28445/g.40130  ORF Transcript_28445/g.40130 Transcript_28445/m.40130 type:complete len:92 (+) Transcript_28445:106-381(+)
MKRASRWLATAVVFFIVWWTLLQGYIFKIDGPLRDIIQVAPIYLIVCFGGYSGVVISYNLMTFPDCSEAAKSLEQEREKAVSDLKAKGFKF